MSRSRRVHQPNISFTAAFALIQALRDPRPDSDSDSMPERLSVERRTEGSVFAAAPDVGPSPYTEPYELFRPDFLNTLSEPHAPVRADVPREER
ncbi:hypothetical protein [Saccharibacillus brassicae]|uniref:Uncharacterized protein n=1 Tax=Saccharibacillus brassicae TaxID=2583377 RepID=A0A4Y6UVB4_SACBS|nr:hypothetical protein [Saccharibacillus brassicae]QDH21672.1 hypothetical protein FFV09_12945 [Saccharibacillus brassicae]